MRAVFRNLWKKYKLLEDENLTEYSTRIVESNKKIVKKIKELEKENYSLRKDINNLAKKYKILDEISDEF